MSFDARPSAALLCLALAAGLTASASAQFATPHITARPGPVSTRLGATRFVNHGLVGVGRISASVLDPLDETFGSVSGLQITDWASGPSSSFRGTMQILPDRGFNTGTFFGDYATRVTSVPFEFTPAQRASAAASDPIATRLASQNQIRFSPSFTTTRFAYDNPMGGTSYATGLDPADGTIEMFGTVVPFVRDYTGRPTPAATTTETWRNVHKLTLDAEALALLPDGSGYLGDEYGALVYYFDANRKIVGAIAPPPAMVPHGPTGVPHFGVTPPAVNGRRANQGMEGVAVSPDGSRLFALLQSATLQDSSGEPRTRRHTRLLVYDITATPTPREPIEVYALTLPTYRSDGRGRRATDVDNTAQQSEIVALDRTRLLVLPRDSNGLGSAAAIPSAYKTVILVDTRVGRPTNLAADSRRNAEGGTIATVTGGTARLDGAIRPLAWVEVINLLDTEQLGRFHVELDRGGQVTKLTMTEKWEGLALVPAIDPAAPDDHFLFVATDNDFLTSAGRVRNAAGVIVDYDGFQNHPPARIPAPVDSPHHESDTVFLAYRVTISGR